MTEKSIKTKKPYGRLNNKKIVEGILKNKPYAQIAEEAGSVAQTDGDKASVISRKISKDVKLQEMLQKAFNANRELAQIVRDNLTIEKIQAMDGKEFIDSAVKLDNAATNLHKAIKLEGGEPTENIQHELSTPMMQLLQKAGALVEPSQEE